MTDIVVPQLGESVTEATVGKWLKAEGDSVAKDEPLVELETDKVAIEVSSPEDGVLEEIHVQEGQTVAVGAFLGAIAGGKAGKKSKKAKDEKARDEGGSKKDKARAAEQPDTGVRVSAGAPGGEEVRKDAGNLIDVAIPQMGESVSEGEVGSWLVAQGASVKEGDPLVEIETDKAAVELPAPASGVLEAQLVKTGEKVEVGSVVARIRTGASAGAATSGAKAEAAAPAPQQSAPAPAAEEAKQMPAARRVIEEKGLDAGAIDGTGRGGRITKGDALAAIDRAAEARPAAKAPSAPGAAPGATRALHEGEERVKMTRLRRTIARRLKQAQDTAAILTTFNDVDMSAIMAARGRYKDLFEKKHGVKLGFMSFFVKACVHALKEIPAANAEVDGEDIIYKNFYDIGVAVGTEEGLVVPVIRDCDAKSMAEIELAINSAGQRARDGKLSIDEMMGGTFTISNGGVYGSLLSTPILNPPQSGILGMHRIEQRPVAIDGKVEIRPMMYLAMSYDHRIVDGKEAVTFLVRVKEQLEAPERLLLDL
jgi:2-oxoglutarate dehydrogenase E2 component (dihydrolipoamide succinyltransferase)